MELIYKPLNIWDKTSIRPGPVGSVGDALVSVKYKKSANYLPDRYDPIFPANNKVAGANVSDGMWYGYVSGGRVARTLQKPLGLQRGFKTAVGWLHEDVRRTDTSRQPIMGSTGQWGWKNKVATVYQAKRTGEMFLPEPMGYDSSQTSNPRGSQIPRIVAQSEGLGKALPAADIPITDPIFGEQGTITDPNQPMEETWVEDKDPEFENAIWVPPNDQANRDTLINEVGYYKYRNPYNRYEGKITPPSALGEQTVYKVGDTTSRYRHYFNEKGWVNRGVPFPKKLVRVPGTSKKMPVPPEKKPTTNVPAPQPGAQVGLSCNPNVQGLSR